MVMEKDNTVEEVHQEGELLVEEVLVDTEKITTNKEKEMNKPLTKLKIGKTLIRLKDHLKEVEEVNMDISVVHVMELNKIGEVQGTMVSDVVEEAVVVQEITLGKKQDHILKETIVIIMMKILKLLK
jgi:hypothetical protein